MAIRNLFLESELKARPLWLVVGWTLVLLVIYFSLTPAPIEVPMEAGDKVSHALAYLVLMLWFANLYEDQAQRVGFALGFLVLDVALEFVQQWTGYRSLETADMVAGAAGVGVGWVLAPPRLPNYLKFIENVCKA